MDFSQGSAELIFLFFKGENYAAPIDVPVSRDGSGQPPLGEGIPEPQRSPSLGLIQCPRVSTSQYAGVA